MRSIRYPGIISYKTPPGGGTTDYAIEIFHAALARGATPASSGPTRTLPMIYMPDAIRATIELMEAPPSSIGVRTSYNLAGISFTPRRARRSEIVKRVPGFRIAYAPDPRQAIADTWPRTIDDSQARSDWAWRARFNLQELVDDMLQHIG